MRVSTDVMALCTAIRDAGGMPYFVGGMVRDHLLGLVPKDTDVEVFRLSGEDLERVIDDVPGVRVIDHVGASFGVYKVTFDTGETIDVSLPRTERKRGTGHRGFDVTPSPWMGPDEACQRRDFTINAIMMDPFTLQVYDLVNGARDLGMRYLRHVSDQFGDDPLRVLRGMQFASRFDMTMGVYTQRECEGLLVEARTLPVERVWGEWEKWSRGVKPSRGLDVLDSTNWVLLYPELSALMLTPQDKEYHPEGNVWQHTRHAVDEAARLSRAEGLTDEDTVVLVFAALLHDIGKPATTEVQPDGRVTSHGHAEEGVLIADMFLRKIGAPDRVRERVVGLVGEHMWNADGGKITPRAVRRLARRLGARHNSVLDLCRLMDTDRNARGMCPKLGSPTAAVLMMEAERASVLDEGPKPVLMGRHLIHLGFQPGREMGNILRCAFERQLDGEFDTLDGALTWLRKEGHYAV